MRGREERGRDGLHVPLAFNILNILFPVMSLTRATPCESRSITPIL